MVSIDKLSKTIEHLNSYETSGNITAAEIILEVTLSNSLSSLNIYSFCLKFEVNNYSEIQTARSTEHHQNPVQLFENRPKNF